MDIWSCRESSRRQNHFPAIDVLDSISRVAPDVLHKEERAIAAVTRNLLATYRDAKI